MQLWKKMKDLMVTGKLTLGKGASLYAFDLNGNAVSVPTGGAEVRTLASALTAAENGKTIFLNSATEFATTLPAPAIGLKFRFVVKAAPSGADYTVVTSGSSNIIYGGISSSDLNAASDAAIGTGNDTISFVSAKAIVGDWVEVESDGTNWYASGNCSVFDAITITTAS